ncbi:MAG TPA: beta-N-acetylhexosaminidase [Sphingobacteriaceae bacterium]
MNRFLICILTLFVFSASAQEFSIIPKPVAIKPGKAGSFFTIDSATMIVVRDSSALKSASFLKDYLATYYQADLMVSSTGNGRNTILLETGKISDQVPGAYNLKATAEKIRITGFDDQGIFYGVQSLIQLLPPATPSSARVPAVDIRDYPRFQYRGLMLDVSRHIFPLDFIKKYIDYIALHKMNYFHWHLTDDQGWRMEIKKHPKLTEVGAWRNGTIIGLFPGTGNDSLRYGGYYTQDQIREVIRYAADRHITVIPEIDIPGHCMAVLATYPELSTTPDLPKEVAQTWGIYNRQNNVLVPSEKTFSFLEDVLSEVAAVFPSPYIHIGGDETAKKWWKESPAAQSFMKEHGLKDEKALQSYFIHRVEKFLNARGKKIIGWNEILEGGLAPNAVVMSWQGIKGGIQAAKEQHPVIMTPSSHLYLNHTQAAKEDSLTAVGRHISLELVYSFDPVPAELTPAESKYIWGAQANIWTEYIANPSKVEYMLFPRLSALSEMVWTPKESRNFEDFKKRLPAQFRRYDLWNANYSREFFKQQAAEKPQTGRSTGNDPRIQGPGL